MCACTCNTSDCVWEFVYVNVCDLYGDIAGFTPAPLLCYEPPCKVLLTVRLTGRY